MNMATLDSFQLLWAQWMGDVNKFRNMLAVVGVVYFGKKTIDILVPLLGAISTHCVSRFRPINLQKFGSWAVVTGPTEGIGKAFAIRLAERGLNVLLLGRNADKLASVADSIEEKYGVDTKIQIIDFNSPGESYQYLKDLLAQLDVAIFVNNAGVINKCPSFINELSEEDIKAMVNVNVKSLTTMTKLAITHFQRKSERSKGVIVNVSSVASIAPSPLLSVYAATKAYVTSFSRAVHEEVRRDGITVQTLIPSYVRTRMVGYSPYLSQSWFVPTPETYVKHALYTLGYSTFTTGYWMHEIQAFFASTCPLYLWTFLIRRGNMTFRAQYHAAHRD